MRILHVIVGLNVGGTEMSLLRLCTKLSERNDFDIKIVTLTPREKLLKEFESLGIQVISLNIKNVFSIPLAVYTYFNLIRKFKPSLVHSWMYHANVFAGLLSFFSSPVIWSLRSTHSSMNKMSMTYFINLISAFFSYLFPVEIICVSESAKKSHKSLGYNSKIMSVIPNGYDFTEIDAFTNNNVPIEIKRIKDSGALIIASVARYDSFKDHNNFIEAAGKILELYDNVYFVLVGEGVDCNNDFITKKIKDVTPKVEKFVLMGFRSDVNNILFNSDIYCLHSISEGFPNGLAEAMCVGLPCVSTNVGDVSLMFGDRLSNNIVPISDSFELFKALSCILNLSANDRFLMGLDFKNRIRESYDINNLINKMYEIYEKAKY